jgi:hypothetical protein
MYNFHMTSLHPHHIYQRIASGTGAIVFHPMQSPVFPGITLPDQGFYRPIDLDWSRYRLLCRHH